MKRIERCKVQSDVYCMICYLFSDPKAQSYTVTETAHWYQLQPIECTHSSNGVVYFVNSY